MWFWKLCWLHFETPGYTVYALYSGCFASSPAMQAKTARLTKGCNAHAGLRRRPCLVAKVATQLQEASNATASSQESYTLVDTPVSNNGARVRFVVRKKGLQSQVKTVATDHFGGGLKSAEFLKLNPQGKFPLLVLPDGSPLPESEVIVQYLLDEFKQHGPELAGPTAKERAVAALITRIHDLYIVPIQACMYRPYPSAEQRAKDIAQIAYQLDAIESTMVGPFMAGNDITTADGAVFPTMVFMTYILPKYFGWGDVFAGRPKLRMWWEAINKDPEASKIIAEIQGGLQKWDDAGRWQTTGIIDQVANNSQLKWAY